jgi:carbon starvation protein
MGSVALTVLSFVGFIVAYRLYGRFLGQKIFGIRDTKEVPACLYEDGVDYVPTRTSILFGHHFTTIGGVGPIVGPAIAVIWGWLPALIWIILGSIFIGGLHDFGSLVVSCRMKGKSIGEVSKDIIGPKVRLLFLFVIFFLLLIVLAVFAYIIAILFRMYPQSVLPIWVEIPIAIWLGVMVYKRKKGVHIPAIIALVLMYATIYLGTLLPFSFDTISGVEVSHPDRVRVEHALADLAAKKPVADVNAALGEGGGFAREVKNGAFDETVPYYLTAKALPLKGALMYKDGTVVEGEIAAASRRKGAREWIEIRTPGGIVHAHVDELKKVSIDQGKANWRAPGRATPVYLYEWVNRGVPEPVFSAFFIKSIDIMESPGSMTLWILILLVYVYLASTLPVHFLLQPRDYINSHELYVGLAMIVIGLFVLMPAMVGPVWNVGNVQDAPAIIPFLFVIIACGAVSGFHSLAASGTTVKQLANEKDSLPIGYGSMLLEGAVAIIVIVACCAGFESIGTWKAHYSSWSAAQGLGAMLSAFVDGSGRFVGALGIPPVLAVAIIAVVIVSFAATTLDSATRIQRYVISELAADLRFKPLTYRHPATLVAVGTAALLVFMPMGGSNVGMALWPIFGAANQMLAGLALLVITVYLLKRGKGAIYALVPMLFVVVITTWAMIMNIVTYVKTRNYTLTVVGLLILVLEIWMIIEAVRAFVAGRKKGFEPVE